MMHGTESLHKVQSAQTARLEHRVKGKPYGSEQQLGQLLDVLETPYQAHVQSSSTAAAATTSAAGATSFPMQTGDTPQPGGNMPTSPPDPLGGGSSELSGAEPQEEAPTRGCGLAGSIDVAAARAAWLHHCSQHQASYELTSAVLEAHPYARQVVPVHLATAVELQRTSDLFLLGHRLMEEHPGDAMSWYASGCYYMACGQYDSARRYFGRATTTDARFAAAWIGFADAFASQDESDQAMAAYRTAARLFPGLAAPLIGLGMEYARLSNFQLSAHMLDAAGTLCPADPLIAHEQGVVALKVRQLAGAEVHFTHALQMASGGLSAEWHPTWLALGHTLRKLHRWDEAAAALLTAHRLLPGQPATHVALGYTYQLQVRLHTTSLRCSVTRSEKLMLNCSRHSCTRVHERDVSRDVGDRFVMMRGRRCRGSCTRRCRSTTRRWLCAVRTF